MFALCVAWPSIAHAELRSVENGLADRGGVVVLPFRSAPPGATGTTVGTAADPVLPFLEAAMQKGAEAAIRSKVVGSALTLVDADEASVRLARATYDPEAAERRTRVRRRIDDAYDEYFALDLPGARRNLAEASGAMERSPQTAADLSILSDIKLLEGIIALSSDPKSADQDFDLLLRLDRTRTLDPKRFPPYAVSALAQAKERFDLLPTTQVNVESDPGDAWISIDGVTVGRTPRTLDRIPTGEHFYRLEKAGMKPLFGRIEFRGGLVEPLSVHLEPTRFFDLQQQILLGQRDHPGAPGAALAHLYSADRVVLATVAPDGPRKFALAMWWADDHGRCSWPIRRSISGEPVEFAREAALLTRDALASPAGESREPVVDIDALSRDVALVAAGSITAPLKPPPRIWYRKNSVRWGVAGGVLLGLLTAVAISSAQPGQVDYNVTVKPNQ